MSKKCFFSYTKKSKKKQYQDIKFSCFRLTWPPLNVSKFLFELIAIVVQWRYRQRILITSNVKNLGASSVHESAEKLKNYNFYRKL